jgi:LPXTG-site transpeptidase (sortase) family protein
LGYLGTGSWLVFYRLNELGKGDQITLKDSNGKEYAYRVTEQIVVGPEDVQVTNPVPGKRLISL